MSPYFDTHPLAGVLLLMIASAWRMMELSHRYATKNARPGATRIGGTGPRLGLLACVIASIIVANLTPHVFPAATIRPGAAAFAAGVVVVLCGMGLRGWSFKVLGQYFTHTVMVSADQPVITAGPYRVLRHPSYAGLLLIAMGVGLSSANWADLAAMTVLVLAPLLWRIHVEESALLATVGERYRAYASHHKRLVPLVW
jgi:protein-S-isoprenylcysteine O-methyltransferase Ste14